jgi:dTDP-4-dehydrorhamnose 3,5-epimerase
MQPMEVRTAQIEGLLLFLPTPHHDERGFFTRVFDAAIAEQHGLSPASFTEDSQSRSHRGVVRGLHGRRGRGEGKLVRCARGAIYDVVVDARPGSPSLGAHEAFYLDDVDFAHLYIPPGMLHGFQVVSDVADVCYRIDRPHDSAEDLSVRYDDPDLGIEWPEPVTTLSERDRRAGTWLALLAALGDA